jgi:catechol 2,3-dioxygenase-like lactoylglutathione lyase family enzyme
MTPDLDAAFEFYGSVLNFSLRTRTADQLIFDLGSEALHVFRCDRQAPMLRHGSDGASVISFEVIDLSEAIRELKGRGVIFLHDKPVRNEDARLSYAAFQAPGGIVHELVERDDVGSSYDVS